MSNVSMIKKYTYAIAFVCVCIFVLPRSSYGQLFFDSEQSRSNTFYAGAVDISLSEESLEGFVNPAQETELSIELREDNGSSVSYAVESGVTGDADFCENLSVDISQDGNSLYGGLIESFEIGTTSEVGDWMLSFELDSEANISEGMQCTLDVSLIAWDERALGPHVGGFTDTETFQVTLTSSMVVLNEVLANPTGDDSQDGVSGEWVELYNNATNAIDLEGWYIEDEAGTRRVIGGSADGFPTTTLGETEIESKEFLVVFMNSQVLNNTDGDTIYLFDSDGVLRETYSYTQGSENKSDARIPDGVGEWIDPVPTPGGPNTVEIFVEVAKVSENFQELAVDDQTEEDGDNLLLDKSESLEGVEKPQEIFEASVSFEEVSDPQDDVEENVAIEDEIIIQEI